MDAQNPSPTWQALLTQAGVVAAGVLVALAIAWGVQSLTWSHRAGAAAARIEPELRQNMEFMAERSLLARCIGHRLDGIEQKLLAANGQWAPPAGQQGGSILPVPARSWTTAAWTTALADGSAAHLDDGPRAFYTRLHGQIARAADLNDAELETTGRLNALTRPLTLSGDRVAELVELIETERARNRSIALVATQAVQTWQQAGRDPADMLKAVRASSPAVKACAGGEAPRQGLPRGRNAPLGGLPSKP